MSVKGGIWLSTIGELTNIRDALPSSDERVIRRGEVYYVDLEGVEYCSQYIKRKSRPALIIQNDIGNARGNTVVVALISRQYNPTKKYPFHVRTLINGNESTIQFEQIMSLDKFRILKKIDTLTEKQMELADKALLYNLALDRLSLENVLRFEVESKITKQTLKETLIFFCFRFDLNHGGCVKMKVPLSALTAFDPAITEQSDIESVRKAIDNCVGLHWIVTHKEFIEI